MVHRRILAVRDLAAPLHGPQVEVDVLRGEEPRVEAPEGQERVPPVRQVAGGVGDVVAGVDQLDPLQVLERAVADLHGLARGHLALRQPAAEVAGPEGARDAVPVDEGHRVPGGPRDPVVPPGPPGASAGVEMDERIVPGEPLHNLPGSILAVGVDHDDLEGRFLDHEALDQGPDVPLLVPDGDDGAEAQQADRTAGLPLVFR